MLNLPNSRTVKMLICGFTWRFWAGLILGHVIKQDIMGGPKGRGGHNARIQRLKVKVLSSVGV